MKNLPSGPRKTQYLGGTTKEVCARASSIFAMRSSDCEIVSRLRKTVSCRSHSNSHKWWRLFRIESRIVSLGKCNGWPGIAALPSLSRREREAVDCHSYCPCQGGDRYQYDKRLIYCRFFRFCHCHPPGIDASGRHIAGECVLGVSVEGSDFAGEKLAYVYFEEEPRRRIAANVGEAAGVGAQGLMRAPTLPSVPQTLQVCLARKRAGARWSSRGPM